MTVRQLERTVEADGVAAKIPSHSSLLRERKASVHCTRMCRDGRQYRSVAGWTGIYVNLSGV